MLYFCCYSEQDTVRAVVQKFGNFEYIHDVGSTTSHLVCGGNRRTLNVLRALARGCWIVSLEWVNIRLEILKHEIFSFIAIAERLAWINCSFKTGSIYRQVLRSLEAGEWLPEEEFERHDFFPTTKVRSMKLRPWTIILYLLNVFFSFI